MGDPFGWTGELLRPYLLSQKKEVDFRSALATVVVERVLDGLTIMGFLVCIILFIPLPLWVHRAGCSVILIDYQYSEREPIRPPEYRVRSLSEAVNCILNHSREKRID